MTDKVVLDMKSFRALSSEMRVSILKALDSRKLTVTDLSESLGITKPALLKHMDDLIEAGLVSKEEKMRKWIYYELTFKGRRILHPETVAITVLLSAAIACLFISMAILAFASPGDVVGPGGQMAGPPKNGNASYTADASGGSPGGNYLWLAFFVPFVGLASAAAIVKLAYRKRKIA